MVLVIIVIKKEKNIQDDLSYKFDNLTCTILRWLVPVSSTSRAYTLTGQYYHSSIVHTKIMALNKCLIIVDPECEGHGFVSRNRLSSAAIGKQSRFNVQKTLEVRLCRVDGKNYPVYLLTYLLILI